MSDISPTTDQITRALERLFVRHRIVVWSDPETQFGDDSTAVALDDVTVLTVANNEFGLKHRILRDERTARFLLYRPGEPPRAAQLVAGRRTGIRQFRGPTGKPCSPKTSDSRKAPDTSRPSMASSSPPPSGARP